jgi:hypothetical protein
MMRSDLVVVVMCVVLAAAGGPCCAQPSGGLLARHGVEPTAESVAAFLSRLSAASAYSRRVRATIDELGANVFAKREAAERQLIELPLKPTRLLEEAAKSADAEVAWRAKRVLAKAEGDEPAAVIAVLCHVIHRRQIKGLAEPLLDAARFVDDRNTRLILERAMATTSGRDDLPALREALAGESAAKRASVIPAIDRLAGPGAIELLKPLLADRDPTVRFNAACCLLNRGEHDGVAALVALLAADQVDLRLRAVLTLRNATGQSFGFDAQGDAPVRSAGLAKWRAYAKAFDAATELNVPATVGAVPAAVLPVFHCEFDGKARDLSKHAHPVRPMGGYKAGFAADRFGRPGQAARFDGADGYYSVLDNETLDTDKQFTLSLWVRLVSYTDTDGSGTFVINKWLYAKQHGDYILAVLPNGQARITVSHSDNGYTADVLVAESAVPLSRWTHLAATFDRGAIRVYQDGIRVGQKTSDTVKHTHTGEYGNDDVNIGSHSNNHYNVNGNLDDVRIYNAALTGDQVYQLYESTWMGP